MLNVSKHINISKNCQDTWWEKESSKVPGLDRPLYRKMGKIWKVYRQN